MDDAVARLAALEHALAVLEASVVDTQARLAHARADLAEMVALAAAPARTPAESEP
jgi:hypothetical protein